jgi:hypothetical protein
MLLAFKKPDFHLSGDDVQFLSAKRGINLGTRYKNIPIEDAVIEYEKKEVSFDCIRLMDAFFDEEAYIWSQGLRNEVVQYDEKAKQQYLEAAFSGVNMTSSDSKIPDEYLLARNKYGKDLDTRYEEAYLVARLQSQFRRAGKHLDWDQLCLDTNIKGSYYALDSVVKRHIVEMRQKRNKLNFRQLFPEKPDHVPTYNRRKRGCHCHWDDSVIRHYSRTKH